MNNILPPKPMAFLFAQAIYHRVETNAQAEIEYPTKQIKMKRFWQSIK